MRLNGYDSTLAIATCRSAPIRRFLATQRFAWLSEEYQNDNRRQLVATIRHVRRLQLAWRAVMTAPLTRFWPIACSRWNSMRALPAAGLAYRQRRRTSGRWAGRSAPALTERRSHTLGMLTVSGLVKEDPAAGRCFGRVTGSFWPQDPLPHGRGSSGGLYRAHR